MVICVKQGFGKHIATNSTIKTFFVSIETIAYTFSGITINGGNNGYGT